MSTYKYITCPKCGTKIRVYKNPVPTVDVIIELGNKGEIVLIKRRNPPMGLAIPGGFVDYGERVEDAAVREAREETGLDVKLKYLLGVYSDPERDSRLHTISTVFVASAKGKPQAGDDAREVVVIRPDAINKPLCFDHERIISDYIKASSSKKQDLSGRVQGQSRKRRQVKKKG